MNASSESLSLDEVTVKTTEAQRLTDDYPPVVQDDTNPPRFEFKTLMQELTYGVTEADAEIEHWANLPGAPWEVMTNQTNTVVEYQSNALGTTPKVRHFRYVTLYRLVGDVDDEDTAKAEAVVSIPPEDLSNPAKLDMPGENRIMRLPSQASPATPAPVEVPEITIIPGVPEHVSARRLIVGRAVTLAQATSSGEYTDDEIRVLAQRELAERQFEHMAAFVPKMSD